MQNNTVFKNGKTFLDSINFGNKNQLDAHNLKISSNVVFETLATEIGAYKKTYDVITLKGKGTNFTTKIKSTPKKDLILEIRELHTRREKAFGYTVLIDEKPVYFRTYEEYGAGPNHFFVMVNSKIVADNSELTLTIKSEGGAQFSIADIWVYDNFFDKIVKEENMSPKMPLYVHFRNLKSKEEMQGYSNFNCYSPVGQHSFITYGNSDLSYTKEKFLKELSFSVDNNSPLSYVISGYGWGGMPTGPDGLGGYFSDPRYSGISYNKETGNYRASWPNMWSSAPFLSICDSNMNAFMKERLDIILCDLKDNLDWMKAKGGKNLPVLVREWGSNGGEYTQENMTKAKKDNVDLNPAKGLGFNERLWMYRNAVSVWQTWADHMAKIADKDSILINNGEVEMPTTQLSTNLYSHPDFLGNWPMNDVRYCAGQIGMVDDMSSSGEMGRGAEYKEIAMNDYLRANGRLAMVNMERTMLKDDFSVLKNHYQKGFQFVVLFNSYEGDEKFIAQMDNIDDEPSFKAVHREPKIFSLNVQYEQTAGNFENVINTENITVQNSTRLGVADNSKKGSVTYKLQNSGEAFETALTLSINGRVSPGDNNYIEVLCGKTVDSLKKVKTLTSNELPCPDYWTPLMTSEAEIELPEDAVGEKEYYIQLVFSSQSAMDAAFIIELTVGTQWTQISGQSDGELLTIGQSRLLSLWVQERVLAEKLLKKYSKISTTDDVYLKGVELIDNGWYRSAAEYLSAEISLALPARFVVTGSGKLAKYPVKVKLPKIDDIAQVTLCKISDNECEFKLNSPIPNQKCEIIFTDFAVNNKFELTEIAQNHYVIKADSDDKNVFKNSDEVSVSLEIEAPTKGKIALPKILKARCLGVSEASITVDFQDHKTMNYNSDISIPFAKDVIFTRCQDGGNNKTNEKPKGLDCVDIKLNDNGEAIEINASYGYEKGLIKSFKEPVLVGELSNGEIEMESGNRYAFHFDKNTGTICDTVALHGTILAYEFRALADAFKKGQQIEITYCPFTTGNNLKRIRTIKQDYAVLLDENFTKTTGDEWKQRAIDINKVDVTDHHPEPNYLQHITLSLLRPTEHFTEGSITYHITSETELKTTAVEFYARAFEDSSRVEFWVSDDNINFKKCGQFDNTWQNSYPQSIDSQTWNYPHQFIDVTNEVKGKNSFYLKAILAVNSADERYCLATLRVLTEK